jgi:hypothetical protein
MSNVKARPLSFYFIPVENRVIENPTSTPMIFIGFAFAVNSKDMRHKLGQAQLGDKVNFHRSCCQDRTANPLEGVRSVGVVK